jgi:hypothetical protein
VIYPTARLIVPTISVLNPNIGAQPSHHPGTGRPRYFNIEVLKNQMRGSNLRNFVLTREGPRRAFRSLNYECYTSKPYWIPRYLRAFHEQRCDPRAANPVFCQAKPKLPRGIVRDAVYPNMYRIVLKDGTLSDMINLARAKDALME